MYKDTDKITNPGFDVVGEHNTAKCFARQYSKEDVEQVQGMCNLPFLKDANIRMMPDMHKGMGCVVGTTMRINGIAVPNFLGVDINCGMLVGKIHTRSIDYELLDKTIRKEVPIGRNIRPFWHGSQGSNFTSTLKRRWEEINDEYVSCSSGTLGGGEIDCLHIG